MADLSLSPAPSAAAPAAAPAPVASRPAAEPLKPEAADPDEDKDETETPTRGGPAVPKATVAGTASSSEGLGGWIPDSLFDGTDEASSGISTGRAPQSQPTLSKAGAVSTDTGSPLFQGATNVGENCPSTDTSCEKAFNKTVPIALSTIIGGGVLLAVILVLLRRRRRGQQSDA